MAKQWTIEDMGRRLKRYVNKLEKEKDNPQAAAAVVMNYAELTGQLIRKSETRVISDEQRRELRELIRQAIQNPDLPMSDNIDSGKLTPNSDKSDSVPSNSRQDALQQAND